jgi:nicotinamidase/pyrazinamidase
LIGIGFSAVLDFNRRKASAPKMHTTSDSLLLVIDVQNDFCPGGALAVADGNAVIDPIHNLAVKFDHIVLTQDWHTPGHSSFASAHAGKKPFEQIEMGYGMQTLWPDHCVQGARGAEFHPALGLTRAELILRKGFRREIDSYSAFFENDRTTATGLAGYLRERGLTRVYLAGLAYDFCVGYSALDARRLGFEAIVLKDACRAIDLDGSVEKMEAEFARAGVVLIESSAVFG